MKVLHLNDGSEIHTPYLTITEAALYCRLDRNKFVPLADQAKVPFIAKGGTRRIYDRRQLDLWMERRAAP